MEATLKECLSDIEAELEEELRTCSYRLWNESVFRYFFARSLLRRWPSLTVQIEWKRIDLLVSGEGRHAVVEIKLYQAVRPSALDCSPMNAKGRVSRRNRAEFDKSVQLLRETSEATWFSGCSPGAIERYMLLAYVVPREAKPESDFAAVYGPLVRGEERNPGLECVSGRERMAPDSQGNRLTVGLFRVR